MTDAQGLTELRGLAAGEWTIVVRATGYSTLTRQLTIRAERVPQDLRLDLARGAIIGGVVRDRFGRRVAGAKVSIGSLSTQTDADGNFRFEDAPVGAQEVTAERADSRAAIAVQLRAGETRLSLAIELPD